MEAGVSGFLEKSEPVQNLIAAIRRTAHGEFLFDATQRKRAQAWNQDAGAKWASLSEREKEVLQWVAKGMNNAAIAKVMDISPKTVAFHVTGILKKLGVSSRNEAIVWVSQYAPIHLE